MAGSVVHMLSAMLAYVIVVGSSILKLPQLYNVLRSRSADGVSLSSLLIEAAGYSIITSWGVARGLDFKDYGEGVIITVQLFVLILLVGSFQRRMTYVAAVYGPILAVGLCLAAGMVPRNIHEAMLSLQIILGLIARFPQIYSNHKRKDTGELALLTFFFAFGGCGARFVTTFFNVPWEKGKAMLMLQFFVATILNFVVVAQIVWYSYLSGARGTKLRATLSRFGIEIPVSPNSDRNV
jgi:mannose-P-dolichol utilization defect protein 1